ncbi:MAG: MarR family transcriptional regulator [Myxococcota bacterium]
MEPSEKELSAFRRTHLGRALARARWTFDAQFADRIRDAGFEDFRPSDVEIIARLPVPDGARITELADRAQISKQAVGKLVRGLEARGYVLRRPDPEDGRAQRIVLSKRGRSLLAAARSVIAEIEEEWAAVLSAAGLTRLRRALLQVSDALGPEEYL